MATFQSSLVIGGGTFLPRPPERRARPDPGLSGSALQQLTSNVRTVFFPPIVGPISPTLPPPPSATASASDLQVMISAIPIAQRGQVITADFHNALRLVLATIANRLGLEPVEEEITVTNAPRLSPVTGAGAWEHDYGLVNRPVDPGNPSRSFRGWMEMELPHGARIKKMVIFGTKTGAGTLKIRLKRQKITDPTVAADLIVIDVPNAADPTKGIEGDVTVHETGAGAVAIEEYRIVNNREEKYLLFVELTEDGTSRSSALFHTVQIVCGP